jgi:hypothetical protein
MRAVGIAAADEFERAAARHRRAERIAAGFHDLEAAGEYGGPGGDPGNDLRTAADARVEIVALAIDYSTPPLNSDVD